jgi:hypothetical protein
MRRIRSWPTGLWTALGCLFLAGCPNREFYTPELEVIEAEVVTPTGPFPIAPIRSGASNCWWPVVFTTIHETFAVRFSALPECEALEIGRLVDHVNAQGAKYRTASSQGIQLQPNLSYYQRNDETPVPLIVGGGRPETSLFDIEAPVALQDFKMNLIGGSLYPASIELIREHEDDRHRFHLAFTVDGEPHYFNVAFRLKLRVVYGYGAPGVP